MKWGPYFHTALKCGLSIFVTGVLSLSPVIPSLPPSPSLSVKCSAQLFVSSCLFVCVYPSPTPHPASPPPAASPSAFSSCKLCFSSCFFHCWASLLLIKVKKEKGAADPTLALSQLQLTETPFHFSPPPLLFSSSSSFHSSLFRPHGSVKTSLPVFVELSSIDMTSSCFMTTTKPTFLLVC